MAGEKWDGSATRCTTSRWHRCRHFRSLPRPLFDANVTSARTSDSPRYSRACSTRAATACFESPGVAERPAPVEWVDDGLDERSCSVVTLITEKRFDEALAVCERLRTDFHDVHDWIERSALVHEARGDFALALDLYRRHVAFITEPERRPGYDEELIEISRSKVVELEARVGDASASSL